MKEDTTPIDPTWMQKTGGFARDMTLHDWYAGMAMQVLKDDIWDFDLLCKQAHELADGMLKAGGRNE
jgi:hypothetical protein